MTFSLPADKLATLVFKFLITRAVSTSKTEKYSTHLVFPFDEISRILIHEYLFIHF